MFISYARHAFVAISCALAIVACGTDPEAPEGLPEAPSLETEGLCTGGCMSGSLCVAGTTNSACGNTGRACTMCIRGQACINGACVKSCDGTTPCDDGNVCSTDICSGTTCVHTYDTDGNTCGANSVCRGGDCNAICTTDADCPVYLQTLVCRTVHCDPTGTMTDAMSSMPGCYLTDQPAGTSCGATTSCDGAGHCCPNVGSCL